MIYDPTKHINRENLAALIGVKTGALATELANYPHGAPTRLGSVRNGRSKIVVYDKKEALVWAKNRGNTSNSRVPPRSIRPLHAQGEYRPSPALSVNFARAGEVYPHRLYTPAGIGNGLEFAPGFDRGR